MGEIKGMQQQQLKEKGNRGWEGIDNVICLQQDDGLSS